MSAPGHALLAALFALAGCGKGEGPPAKGPGGGKPAVAFPVEVVPVERAQVESAVAAVGSVEAFERVHVVARVPGVVEKVHFVEGQTVKKDQPLAHIEPARYALAVKVARAALVKAQASAADAETAAGRRAAVEENNPGLIPGEELESFKTRAQASAADVTQAKAALEQAQLNLRDAYVRAPVAGVIQTRTVETGQYVQPGAVLATLLRRDPLLLRFEVPEPEAARLRPNLTAHFKVRGDASDYRARITHVAGSASATTRMVAITAEVQSESASRLTPGAFAEVNVPVGTTEAPVIPQTAVRPSERGFLAYVVEGEVARERILTLGLRTPDGRVEVRNGLQPGESLVIRGTEALREGVNVRVVQSAANTGQDELAPAGGGGGSPPRGDR
jgi:multidrug efflux system membrane fusion protein